MRTIVVGVDASDASKNALRWALENAREDDTVVAFHAWQIHAVGTLEVPSYNPSDFEVNAFRSVRQVIDEVAGPEGERPDKPQIKVEVVHGDASSALMDRARTADLVVIGSRGLGGFRGLLQCSVSTQVVHHIECPVVIIRP
jgi:nucleotide-binding universal stress UspA family protein